MRRLACSATLLALAALPGTAGAAVTVTDAKIQPSTTAAGAHPNLTIDLSFGQSPTTDDLRDVTVILPQGLVGNPKAADRCSQASFQADTCPAATKVGTTVVTAIPTVIVDGPAQESPGDVYNLAPTGGEPGRLGVVVRPTLPGASKIFLQSAAVIGPETSYGLRTTFTDLPRTSGPADIRVTRQVLTLNGQAAHGAFLTNPTGCGPATMTVLTTSYDDAAHPGGRQASFTPTACDALAFTPAFSGTIGGAGNTAKGASPQLTTSIVYTAGQANTRRASVIPPSSVVPDVTHPTCSADALAANTCPAEAQVGTATAQSPVLDSPLTGPVWFVSPTGGGLPQLAVQLSGQVAVTLIGNAELIGGKLANTFDNQPDVPLDRFDLTLAGGPGGLLKNATDLCAAGADLTAGGSFTAHNDKVFDVSAPLTLQGCPPPQPGPPSAAYELLPGRNGHRMLIGRFAAGTRAPGLVKVRVDLPPKLSPGAPDPKQRITAYADGKKLGPLAIRVRNKGRRLTLILKGVRKVGFRWRGLVPLPGGAAHPQIGTQITDAKGKVTTLSPPAAR
ncbi:MAG TPA: hypothetical protein VJT75_05205 [Thermoleophilaceae bacterium]|nr:hypothetical protein [Thermoleophilaceae bacterium]